MFKDRRTIPYIDTSGWKFENVIQTNPTKVCNEIVQQKKDVFLNMNQSLEEETETQTETIEQIQIIEENFESDAPKTIPDDNNKLVELKLETKEREKLKSLREPEAIPNPYLVLLNRLDEEEGVRAPSIEDKLKVTEDRLWLSTREFCSTCEQLIGVEEQDKSKTYEYLQPKAVQEALRPKVFEPSLRPPQTLHVAEFKKEVIHEEDKDTFHPGNVKKAKVGKKKYLKQDFYSPPDTWFDLGKHDEQITQEELELLNSTATKAFLKFLKDRKKEPPKIIQDIKKKVIDMKSEN